MRRDRDRDQQHKIHVLWLRAHIIMCMQRIYMQRIYLTFTNRLSLYTILRILVPGLGWSRPKNPRPEGSRPRSRQRPEWSRPRPKNKTKQNKTYNAAEEYWSWFVSVAVSVAVNYLILTGLMGRGMTIKFFVWMPESPLTYRNAHVYC